MIQDRAPHVTATGVICKSLQNLVRSYVRAGRDMRLIRYMGKGLGAVCPSLAAVRAWAGYELRLSESREEG